MVMPKITFMGAGSTIFARNIVGECLLTPALQNSHIALYDISAKRLKESKAILEHVNTRINKGRAKITAHLGERSRRTALREAHYVVNAIQVGGYEPSTVIDFEVPKKYGLRQTIGDTLGIGGIFRALRTIPVLFDFARDIEAVCPDAWFLNYSNPMSILTGATLHHTGVKTVGLCHSVPSCAPGLLKMLGMYDKVKKLQWKIAGINHMAWLLEVTDGGKDLYPEIKRRAKQYVARARKGKMEKPEPWGWDTVRLEMMLQFGHYITESSEHTAEYSPYWIKSAYPDLIEEFSIPLDEYPRRCVEQIEDWEKKRREIALDKNLPTFRWGLFAPVIMEAIETDAPARVAGNILNHGLITNFPAKACVEVPCLVDRNGVQGCHVGELPEQCAALNRNAINVQLLTIEAAVSRKKEKIYQAAMLDPHTAAELSLDKIRALCDDLIAAHGKMLPRYR